MIRSLLFLPCIFFGSLWASEGNAQGNKPSKPTHVEIIILNKATTKSENLVAPIGVLTHYRDLQIRPYSCDAATLGLGMQVVIAFIEVWQDSEINRKNNMENNSPQLLYSNYMDSQRPLLEHDTYTMKLNQCVIIDPNQPIISTPE